MNQQVCTTEGANEIDGKGVGREGVGCGCGVGRTLYYPLITGCRRHETLFHSIYFIYAITIKNMQCPTVQLLTELYIARCALNIDGKNRAIGQTTIYKVNPWL